MAVGCHVTVGIFQQQQQKGRLSVSCHLTSDTVSIQKSACANTRTHTHTHTPLHRATATQAAGHQPHTPAERGFNLRAVYAMVSRLTWEETTGEEERMSARLKPTHVEEEEEEEEEEEASMQATVCTSVLSLFFVFSYISLSSNITNRMRHYTDLPVGALSPHRIFPVRNDVGSVVRDDVVVILSIWGKGLGGTGHLGL